MGKDGLVPIRTGGMGWEGFQRLGPGLVRIRTGWDGLDVWGLNGKG